MMDNMLLDWKINKHSLSGITTDNASNMKKAFETFPCVWFSCFGHNLNLAILKVLKIQKVDVAIRSCRHMVDGFSKSWKKTHALQKKQRELDLPEHALIHDVVTRWGSTYEMVARFIEQQQAICAVLAGDRNTWHLMPKDREITVLEEVSQLLGPLHEFTDILASEKQVTLSALMSVLEHISNEILQEQPTDSNLTKQMKEIMRKYLLTQLRYTEEMKNVLNISSFMDPRFKGNFSENLDQTVKGCIEEAMALAPHLILDEPSAEATQSPPFSSSSTTTTTTTTTTTKMKEKSLCGLLKKITAARITAG